MTTLYMKLTKDEYQLPIVVATSVKECATLSGNSYKGLKSVFSKIRHGHKQTGWDIVTIDEDE